LTAVLLLCAAEEGEDSSKTADQTWGDTDRDYTYDEVPPYCISVYRKWCENCKQLLEAVYSKE